MAIWRQLAEILNRIWFTFTYIYIRCRSNELIIFVFFSFFSLFCGFRAIGFRVVLLSFLAGTYFWRFTHAKCLSKLLPKVLFWINTLIYVIPGIGWISLWSRVDMQQSEWKWVIWLVFEHFVCCEPSRLYPFCRVNCKHKFNLLCHQMIYLNANKRKSFLV